MLVAYHVQGGARVDRCDACGVHYDDIPRALLPDLLREHAQRFTAVVAAAQARSVLRSRPAPEVWSALEYACHVRDVFIVQRQRLEQARHEHQPTFVPMGRDERAISERYNDQDPQQVVEELIEAADALASAFEVLDETGWQRTGIYNWPQPAERTMVWLARHTIHEVMHHLLDITRGVDRLAAEPHGT